MFVGHFPQDAEPSMNYPPLAFTANLDLSPQKTVTRTCKSG
ncbi:hypothetical protein EMIT0P395_20299 [Pseudomonas sp. IT-P395]